MSPLRQVLLLVQSALAGLVALGTFVFWLGTRSPALGLLAAAGAALALIPLVVAIGLGMRRRWAQGLGIGYELLLLVSGVADVLVLRNDDLVSTAVDVILPATLLWLLISRPPTMGAWSSAASQAGSTRS